MTLFKVLRERERESGLKKSLKYLYLKNELYELKECDFYEYGMIIGYKATVLVLISKGEK